MSNRDKTEFKETINISSNIKDNKNTIIGKFDLKDILFILIAVVVGIGVLSVLLVVLSIRNMFLILIILALFEVPIVTLGFLKLHNIPVLDYIKMKSKSDNKSYRKQILRKKQSKVDKYILTICLSDDLVRLEQVMNDLYAIIQYKNIEVKIIFNKIYITIEVIGVENIVDVLFDKLFDYLRINKDIKYISNEDIKSFEMYINSLKFADKRYGKKQNKTIIGLKARLNKIKRVEEIKDRYNYLTNRILDVKDDKYVKVYKFLLYKSPFDASVFNELKEFCNITSHIKIDTYETNNSEKKICFNELSFINTFIDINCRGEGCGTAYAISDLEKKIKEILDKYHILYKEIDEDKVKDSLLFLMENKF